MRTRSLTLTTVAISALGLGTFVLGAAPPASAKSVSSQNLKALSTQINKGKHLTYSVQYKTVSNGTTSTVSIAQAPPKTYFSSGGSVIINNGKTTYYCSPNESGNSGDSGNSGSGDSGDSGNSGNSGAATTTSTTKASSSGSLQCLTQKGASPLADTEDLFTAGSVLSVFSEAEQSAIARVLGIKVSGSTAKYAGQPSTCISVTRKGQSGKYCVTKQGLLSYSGSGKSYFEMVKYSAHPSSSLFTLPAGATTDTIPNTP